MGCCQTRDSNEVLLSPKNTIHNATGSKQEKSNNEITFGEKENSQYNSNRKKNTLSAKFSDVKYDVKKGNEELINLREEGAHKHQQSKDQLLYDLNPLNSKRTNDVDSVITRNEKKISDRKNDISANSSPLIPSPTVSDKKLPHFALVMNEPSESHKTFSPPQSVLPSQIPEEIKREESKPLQKCESQNISQQQKRDQILGRMNRVLNTEKNSVNPKQESSTEIKVQTMEEKINKKKFRPFEPAKSVMNRAKLLQEHLLSGQDPNQQEKAEDHYTNILIEKPIVQQKKKKKLPELNFN